MSQKSWDRCGRCWLWESVPGLLRHILCFENHISILMITNFQIDSKKHFLSLCHSTTLLSLCLALFLRVMLCPLFIISSSVWISVWPPSKVDSLSFSSLSLGYHSRLIVDCEMATDWNEESSYITGGVFYCDSLTLKCIFWTEFLALKHTSRILGNLSNPVCGLSMME